MPPTVAFSSTFLLLVSYNTLTKKKLDVGDPGLYASWQLLFHHWGKPGLKFKQKFEVETMD